MNSKELALTVIIIALTTTVVMARKKSSSSDSSSSDSSKSKETSHEYDDDNVDHTLDQKGSLNKKFVITAVLSAPHKSVVCSPVSALMPLGKLALGADKTALRELMLAIGVSKKKEIGSKFKKLINSLQKLPGVKLSIASRLYLSSDKRLTSKFKNNAQKIFHSSVEQTNFKKPDDAAHAINKWIRAQTMGMIKNIISPDEISPSSSIIIANAIYFSGEWVYPFEKVETGSFYTPWGTQRIPIMKKTDRLKYYKSDALSAQILELPYKGYAASLLIILPSTRDGLPVLLNALKLSPSLLTSALKRMTTTKVKVSIPKFKTETELDLADIYNKIGVREIFSRGAGLKGLVKDEKVFVSKAIQKAVIEVTHIGTEAAAASVVGGLGVAPPSDYQETVFNADHPFLYYVTAGRVQLFGGVFNKQS